MNADDFILPKYSTQDPIQRQQHRKRRRSVSSDPNNSQLQRSQEPNQLWIDKYTPTSTLDIGVHKTKIVEVERALAYSAINNGLIKLLLLQGPTGCGKSSLVNILCQDLGYNVTEWITSERNAESPQPPIEEFGRFMRECTHYNTLSSIATPHKGRVILLDDVPDLTTEEVKDKFHAILKNTLNINKPFLVVMVVSDALSRSENRYESMENFLFTVLSNELKEDQRVKTISFKSVADTQMKKILISIAMREKVIVPQVQLEKLISSSDGDIRLAINTLQFLSHTMGDHLPEKSHKKQLKGKNGSKIVEFDNHIGYLQLFHAVGKVLYAKRDGRGHYESKPEHILNKIPIDTDYFINYLHQNCIDFFKKDEMESCAKAFTELSDADTLSSVIDWQDKTASLYRGYVSIHGIMKNRSSEMKGALRELAGIKFHKAQMDSISRAKLAYHHTWMESVKSRNGEYEKEYEGWDMLDDPIEPFSDDEDAFDNIFGDGSDLADLDF